MQENAFKMSICTARSMKIASYFNICISLLSKMMQVQSNSNTFNSVLLRKEMLRNYFNVNH